MAPRSDGSAVFRLSVQGIALAFFCTVVASLCFPSTLRASTEVSGPIATDTTWVIAGSPYIITDDATVEAGVTLTIQPGVVVKFESATDDLIVKGTLIADGSGGSPIYFTSIDDHSVGGATGDGSPAPNDWSSVRLMPTSSGSVLDNVVVRYGGGWFSENVYVATPAVTLRNSTIAHSGEYGIKFDNVLPAAITNLRFENNALAAAYADLDENTDSVVLMGNSGSGNEFNGLLVTGTISGTVTWDGDDAFPFVVHSDLTVQPGATLTLTPGTVVKFRYSTDELLVNGALIADASGPGESPILFTSDQDDSVGGDTDDDGDATPPAPSDWSAISFSSTSSGSVLDNVVVRYGGGWLHENIHVETSSITLRNSTIAHSGEYGITFQNALPAALINLRFEDNALAAARANLDDNADSVALMGNSGSGNEFNGLLVTGTISGTVTWDGDDAFPFVVHSDLTVQPGATLTLTPGTVVKFRYSTDELLVNGALIADASGPGESPILFTSDQDDSVGGDTDDDGSDSAPIAGDWGSLRFGSTSSGSVIDNVVARYGGGWWSEQIWIHTDEITLRNSVSTLSKQSGLTVEGAAPTVYASEFSKNETGVSFRAGSTGWITDSMILQNTRYGLYVSAGAAPTLRNNAILGNGEYGVYHVDSSTVTDAADNYWGSPSGPLHTTTNPAAIGDRVSNFVSYVPWQPMPKNGLLTGNVLFSAVGPGRVSPGQRATYSLSYANLTTKTIESAVAVVVLPFSAEYLNSTDDGIYWPEKHQAFWRLGDLSPGEGGVISVNVRFFWGLPDDLQDEAMGLLLAANIEDCPLDPQPYRTYTQRSFTATTELATAEVNQDRQSYADLETIYQDALAQGYQFVNAVEKQTNSGAVIRQITLIRFERASVMYLLRQGSRVQALIYEPDAFGVRTATGGYVRDLAGGNITYWGSWSGSGQLSLAETQILDEGACFFNCVVENLPGWLVSNKVKAIGSLLAANDCYICKTTGNEDACLKCGGAIRDLPGVGEAVDTLRCGSDCAENPDSHLCSADKRTCDQSLWNIYHLLDVPTYKVLRCLGGRYAPLPEIVTCAFGTKCVEDQGCVDCNASGADCNRTSVRIARDPNAKYGPPGELLPGQTVTYTVTYENEGGGTAFGVFVVDELSEYFDPGSIVLSEDGTFYPESRLISWNVGELAPKGEIGSEGVVTLTATLKHGLPSGTVIRNQATVYFPSVPEVTPTNAVVNTIQALVAEPQTLAVESGQPLAIALTGKDASAATLSYMLVDEPLYGWLTGQPPNLTYTSRAGFSGQDRFTFRVNNAVAASVPGEVVIQVEPWSGDTDPPALEWVQPAADQNLPGVATTPAFTDTAGAVYPPMLLAKFSEPLDSSTVTTQTVQSARRGRKSTAHRRRL